MSSVSNQTTATTTTTDSLTSTSIEDSNLLIDGITSIRPIVTQPGIPSHLHGDQSDITGMGGGIGGVYGSDTIGGPGTQHSSAITQT